MSTPRAVRITMGNALRETLSNRAALWTGAASMIVNDAAWIVFWVLFFHRVGALRGWDTSSVLLLQAALTTSGGIVLGLFADTRAIGRLIANGEIDAALALPVRPLLHLLVRRVNAVNLGDIAFGVTLFVVACHPTPTRAAVFAVAVAVSVVVLASFLVAVGSLAFFAGREDSGDLGFHAMLLFAAYPTEIFGGSARLLLHTVIPAAFVAAVPARLVEHFDGGVALGFVVAALVTATVAVTLFQVGLRRYTSGAVWTRA
jgi:viologen exporter family transport system permease protein